MARARTWRTDAAALLALVAILGPVCPSGLAASPQAQTAPPRRQGPIDADRLSRTPGYFVGMATGHFHLYCPSRNRNVLQILARDAEGFLAEIAADLGAGPRAPIGVFILSRDEDVAQLAFPLPRTPEWASGYAVPGRRIIVLRTARLTGALRPDVKSTFRHELVHILVSDITGPYASLVPRWFNEGLAMVFTRAWGLRERINLSRHLITRRIIPLDELTTRFPGSQAAAQLAYAESYLFVAHIREVYGPEAPGAILRQVGSGKTFAEAFRGATGRGLADTEEIWLARLKWRYKYIPIATSSVTLWAGVTLLFILGYVRKKRRNRETLDRWEEEEGGIW